MTIFGARRPQKEEPSAVTGAYFEDGMTDISTGQALTSRTADIRGSYRDVDNQCVYLDDFSIKYIQTDAITAVHIAEFIPEPGYTASSDQIRVECTFNMRGTITTSGWVSLWFFLSGDTPTTGTRLTFQIRAINNGTAWELRVRKDDGDGTLDVIEQINVGARTAWRLVSEAKILNDSQIQMNININGTNWVNQKTYSWNSSGRGNRTYLNMWASGTADASRIGTNNDIDSVLRLTNDLQVL